MSELRRAIAIGFDGCLCKNMWPNIGLPNFDAINAAIRAKQEGAALILWTCRAGEKLENAIQFCKNYDLEFDAVNEVDIPKELKRWTERCIWHVRKCSELSEKLGRAKEEAECFHNNYAIQVNEKECLSRKLLRAEKLIAAMKADLLLAASGHCCGICARKTECADVAQVTCCSAFRYYKTEEE